MTQMHVAIYAVREISISMMYHCGPDFVRAHFSSRSAGPLRGNVPLAVGAYNGGPGNPNMKYEEGVRMAAQHARTVFGTCGGHCKAGRLPKCAS